MAFLVIEVDDFLVAADDDFLVTEDDTVPGTGFDGVAIGATPAAAARLGAQTLSMGRVGSAIIWDEVAAFLGPASAFLAVSGFAPSITMPSPITVYPATASMALSGLAPDISTGGGIRTYMGPGGAVLIPPATSAALHFQAAGSSFVFDH